jgi:hypothetical protein
MKWLLVIGLVLVTAGCGGDDQPDAGGREPSPTSSQFSLTPVPLPPEPPPSGKLIVAIEQSTRDGAANRFQVWVDNDTDSLITPTKVTYRDDRFRTALPATRLRDIPSQSRRGFPIYEPKRPACGSKATTGTLTVDYTVHGEQKTTTVPVEDEADVIERITSARCLELTIAQVAHLSWADEVTASGDGGKGSVGTLTLVVDTTGKPGPEVVIDTIVGNPVLSPGERGVFQADLTITGEQPSQRIPVPLKPTRCDAHAFAAAGNFAEFAVNVHVDGKPGQIVLSLSPAGAANAVHFAEASCGFLTTP